MRLLQSGRPKLQLPEPGSHRLQGRSSLQRLLLAERLHCAWRPVQQRPRSSVGKL